MEQLQQQADTELWDPRELFLGKKHVSMGQKLDKEQNKNHGCTGRFFLLAPLNILRKLFVMGKGVGSNIKYCVDCSFDVFAVLPL